MNVQPISHSETKIEPVGHRSRTQIQICYIELSHFREVDIIC